ncbi:MAG: precorrin-6A reductase, partial [Lachnospiraceae bacterium]|nr:precorrin-6A reductase [Lachnospiraceae bacterium]
MKRVFLFAGTSEGRHLAKLLSAAGVACTVSVATEYGAETMLQDAPALYGTRILQGRMMHAEMCTAFADAEAELVVDATHPFATKVSEEIRFACAESGLTYLRLARNTADASADGSSMRVFDNADDALSFLNEREGNILFLTGSRDIRSFAAAIDDRSRVFARVLPSAESIAACTEAGLSGKQIFAMQGPFSEEMNLALLRDTGAKFLLTKETGSAGGFPEKLAAAQKASVTAVVIANPEARDTGEKYDFEEMCAVLSGRLGVSLAEEERVLTLAGIGPGAPEMMTLAVREAIGNAEVLFGAPRMTEGAAAIAPHAAIVKEYKEEAVHAYLQAHPGVRRAVLLYSGDVGIYSGAAKMRAPEGWRLAILPGISSLVYFCAKLHTPWQD